MRGIDCTVPAWTAFEMEVGSELANSWIRARTVCISSTTFRTHGDGGGGRALSLSLHHEKSRLFSLSVEWYLKEFLIAQSRRETLFFQIGPGTFGERHCSMVLTGTAPRNDRWHRRPLANLPRCPNKKRHNVMINRSSYYACWFEYALISHRCQIDTYAENSVVVHENHDSGGAGQVVFAGAVVWQHRCGGGEGDKRWRISRNDKKNHSELIAPLMIVIKW